jgi:hypothetical protein
MVGYQLSVLDEVAYNSANIAVCYPGYRIVEEVLKEHHSFGPFYFHTGPEEWKECY